jgi:hypothetical protein
VSAKLRIGAKEYELPSSFTLGEARVIKRYTGLNLKQFAEADNASDPDAIAALVYIVLKRENPRVTEEDVDELGLEDVGDVEDDARPPERPETSAKPDAGNAPSGETG